jgi:F0F1-type ATP synthase delta subunit
MNTVTSFISTVVERDFLVNFLYQLGYFAFRTDSSLKDFIIKNVPVKMQESLFQYFSQEIENNNIDALLLKSKSLIKELSSLPVITLTVMVIPSEQVCSSIGKWLEENAGIKVLLQFATDESVAGGAIIESKGFVRDYTIKNYFEKRLEGLNGF